MDNNHLRDIILKVTHSLSNDDRQSLHFVLCNDVPRRNNDDSSLSDTLSLLESRFDQDKMNEQDLIILINALEAIQCTDAVKILKKHMKRVSTNESKESKENLISSQNDEDCSLKYVLMDQKKCSDDKKLMINSNSFTVVLDDQLKVSLRSKSKQILKLITIGQIFLFLLILISFTLIGVVIGDYFKVSQLRLKYENILHEQEKNNQIIQYLKVIQSANEENNQYLKAIQSKNEGNSQYLNITSSTYNETAQKSTTEGPVEEDQSSLQFIEGTTCGCEQWCKKYGSSYGVCGDGHTCICRQNPITKDNIGEGCTCDGWCKRHDYQNGGICGDGYTCICSL